MSDEFVQTPSDRYLKSIANSIRNKTCFNCGEQGYKTGQNGEYYCKPCWEKQK